MRFRKLRIAWTVFCGIACVLLIALWVRSYWRYDFTQSGGVTSANGNLHIGRNVEITRYADRTPSPQQPTRSPFGMFSITSEGVTAVPSGNGITLPYWLLLIPIFALATCAWIRFTLRTLLIATTLVALVLGLIVWLNHR
jgi:hypothetical protein